MKLPRDLSGRELIRRLERLGSQVSRCRGSHVRLTTQQQGEHHITIPDHDEIRPGTLSSILSDVAIHFGMEREELARRLLSE
ncbi:MAG: type II toxin-antitoxin system HicA family toxin [Planctomycetaceae bacterium]